MVCFGSSNLEHKGVLRIQEIIGSVISGLFIVLKNLHKSISHKSTEEKKMLRNERAHMICFL